MEDDEIDSLFEGMVLFTPSQLATGENAEVEFDHQSQSQSQSPSESRSHDTPFELEKTATTTAGTSEPLDENLFSDLTLQTLENQDQPSPSPTVITISKKNSRKKKIAAGLRIGSSRDMHPQSAPSNVDDNDDDDPNAINDASSTSTSTSTTSIIKDLNPHQRFQHLKVLISDKISAVREFAASVSAARKDAIRRRRKAADDLHSASLNHSHLEKQLDDACEAEDFDTAQRISNDLAAAENYKKSLLIALRDAEAHCDAVDSQMHQALLSQIAAEEDSASLLDHLSADAVSNADMLLKKAEALSSEEMDKWLSSTEALEGRKIELEIESHLVNEARLLLNDSIAHSIEDDQSEKEFLHKRKDMLTDELQKLLALVREKEKEIAENDSKIQAVEERIADVVSGFQGFQSTIDAKYDNLQSGLSQLDLESEGLSMKKKEIDEFLNEEVHRATKLKELATVSADEAKAYQEVVELRRSLMLSVLKSGEDKLRLAKTEQKLLEDVQMLQQEVSAARASLQELSSMRSSIQQNVASFKQRMLFIDKRAPELEAEKKVATAARNFKEAARISAEAKSLSVEKDGLQIKMEKAVLELEELEKNIKKTVNQLQETEGLISSKEKEVAVARFQRLHIIAAAAMADRSAALELGDLEEANLLLAEAEAADHEAKKMQSVYNFKEKEFAKLPKHFISMEIVAHFGRQQLKELAANVLKPVPLST